MIKSNWRLLVIKSQDGESARSGSAAVATRSRRRGDRM